MVQHPDPEHCVIGMPYYRKSTVEIVLDRLKLDTKNIIATIEQVEKFRATKEYRESQELDKWKHLRLSP